jgi:tRNA A-37 threonylcarbamoyl transferase component Bud32
MLQNAAHKLLTGQLNLNEDTEMREPESDLNAYLGQMSPANLLKNIRIDQFKAPNLTLGTDGRLLRVEEEEEKHGIEVNRPNSPMMIQEALRLPNISLKSAAESIQGV